MWMKEKKTWSLWIPKIFCCHFSKDCIWMRFFGRGFSFFNYPPLFSERNGYQKIFKLGFGWRFKFLKHWKEH
jgi:hypothetical protein